LNQKAAVREHIFDVDDNLKMSEILRVLDTVENVFVMWKKSVTRPPNITKNPKENCCTELHERYPEN